MQATVNFAVCCVFDDAELGGFQQTLDAPESSDYCWFLGVPDLAHESDPKALNEPKESESK